MGQGEPASTISVNFVLGRGDPAPTKKYYLPVDFPAEQVPQKPEYMRNEYRKKLYAADILTLIFGIDKELFSNRSCLTDGNDTNKALQFNLPKAGSLRKVIMQPGIAVSKKDSAVTYIFSPGEKKY